MSRNILTSAPCASAPSPFAGFPAFTPSPSRALWISLGLASNVTTVSCAFCPFGAAQAAITSIGYTSAKFGNLRGATLQGIVIVFFSVAVLGFMAWLLTRTRLGLFVRAVTQNRTMAAAMGIRTPWIDALTFGLGSGVAGMAGVALSQIDNVSPNLGQSYIIDSFMVVVFGGVGNLWGTLVGAFTLGIANKFLEPYAGAVLGKIAILVLIILFIQKRPRGLFALKGRAVEA